MTVEETSTAKTALRRRLRATRREPLADRDVEAEATALADHVTASSRTTRRVGYAAWRPTSRAHRTPDPPLVDRLAAAGYEVVVPITLADLDLDWRVAGSTDTLGLNAIHDARSSSPPPSLRTGMAGGSVRAAAPTTAHWPDGTPTR